METQEQQDQAQSQTAPPDPEALGPEAEGEAPEEKASTPAAPTQAPTQHLAATGQKTGTGRSARKERVGTVVSAKMEKTIVVAVQRQKKHPMYDKYLKRTSRFMAHDETNDAGEGDTVLIMETRPLSKHKRWRLVEVLERAA